MKTHTEGLLLRGEQYIQRKKATIALFLESKEQVEPFVGGQIHCMTSTSLKKKKNQIKSQKQSIIQSSNVTEITDRDKCLS